MMHECIMTTKDGPKGSTRLLTSLQPQQGTQQQQRPPGKGTMVGRCPLCLWMASELIIPSKAFCLVGEVVEISGFNKNVITGETLSWEIHN